MSPRAVSNGAAFGAVDNRRLPCSAIPASVKPVLRPLRGSLPLGYVCADSATVNASGVHGRRAARARRGAHHQEQTGCPVASNSEQRLGMPNEWSEKVHSDHMLNADAAGSMRIADQRCCCRNTSYTAIATVVDKFSDRTRSDIIGIRTNRSE